MRFLRIEGHCVNLQQQILLRGTAFVLFIAFLGAWLQNEALIGDDGLEPAGQFLNNVARHFGTSRTQMQSLTISEILFDSEPGSKSRAFRAAPTLLWWAPVAQLTQQLTFFAATGAVGSLTIALTGRANMIIMVALWAAYFSIISVGQVFYQFGWESQLLETSIIAALLVDPLSLTPPTKSPTAAIYLFRWLLFRVMFGSGMIKVRGDPCWRDMTCTHYHYETQPIPNPLSLLLHSTPVWFHKLEVWVNHFVEIVVPWFVMLPQPAATIGGVIQLLFQGAIIISGNLSFLNWLTIVPTVACIDEKMMRLLFRCCKQRTPHPFRWSRAPIALLHLTFVILVGCHSVPVIENLFTTDNRQVMNGHYDWLRFVNTYGNFGSVNRVRHEIIMEGRSSSNPEQWYAYQFPCKPGNVHRRPCFTSPFHYRLDWQMWIATFQSIENQLWLKRLALFALQCDQNAKARSVLSDLGVESPFDGCDDRPTEIRMWLQEIRFSDAAPRSIPVFLTAVGWSIISQNRTLPFPIWEAGRLRTFLSKVNESAIRASLEARRGRQ